MSNILLGYGAALPAAPLPQTNAIVLGASGETVYLGGAQGGAGASLSATALTLYGELRAGGTAGGAGQALESSGSGAYWGAAPGVEGAAEMTAPYASMYVITSGTFALSAGYAGQRVVLKNKGGSTCAVTSAATNIVEGTSAPAGSINLTTGAAATLCSNGTSWYNTTVTTVSPPIVTSVSPASGPLAGGTLITITGTAFTGATVVSVGDNLATSFSVVDSTRITATAPAGSIGTASVLVTTPGGTSAANTRYSYAAVPTVTSVSPASGPLAGGTPITITGTAFTGATAVSVGDNLATSVSVVDSTRITATAPAGSIGTASVLVTTPGGTSAANTLYSYTAAVTSVSPAYSLLAGGDSVTITGAGFTNASAVTIGGAAATSFSVVDSTRITATAPAGSAGTASVNVTTPGGTSTDNILFTYYATTSTYNYTGANQEFVVPFDCKITAIVAGSVGTWGANGAVITGTFTATAGSKLAIVVGHYNSTYAGGTNNQYGTNGGGGGYSAVINGPSNVNSNGTPIANEPNCIYIMAGGGGGGVIGYGLYRFGTGGLWNANANPMSQGGIGGVGSAGAITVTGGYTTNYIGNGAGGVGTTTNGAKFTGGNSSGAGGYYGGGGYSTTYGGGGGGSSYVNQSVTAVTSAATNEDAGTVTLTIVQ